MTIAVVLITVFFVSSVQAAALVPGRMQSVAELAYEFVANMLRTNVGSEGRAYFPFIFSLFFFILLGNMLGMMPYGFTFTAQLVVTLGMALVVFIGTTIIGFVKHGVGFSVFPAARHAVVHRAAAGSDRDPVVFLPADQSVVAPVREHDRRAHPAEGFRRIYRRLRRRSASSGFCRG